MHNGAILFKSYEECSKNSASGGAFYTIAKCFLKNYNCAKVYGAAFVDNDVKHIGVERVSDLQKLQGSKYVQSNMKGVYNAIQNELEKGIKVLFSGTPCQVAALKLFLKKEYNILWTIDILCHGVPSPQYWREHLKILENKYSGRLQNISFRNPSKYNRYGYILRFTVGGRVYQRIASEDTYYNAFINSYSLRPSCYECPFPGNKRPGDISLGDSSADYFHKNEAVSLVLVNSCNAQKMISCLKKHGDVIEARIDEEICGNFQMIKPSKRPNNRDFFYKNDNYSAETRISIKEFVSNRIKNHIPTIWKNFLKNFMNRKV